mmetsp:Transcript_3564/g.10127  ORF Transcript_3564/g.10127 Transcript_3564/m.10127 type:complete len:319 (-) Transcript_3564:461-1417(-)
MLAILATGVDELDFIQGHQVERIPVPQNRIFIVIGSTSSTSISGRSDGGLPLQRTEGINIGQQLLQLIDLQIPKEDVGLFQLRLERFQLVEGIVLLLILDGGPVLLLLIGKAKEEQVLGQNIDRLLPPLHEADGRTLPLLLEVELLLLPGPLVVVLQLLHPALLGTDALHLLEVRLPILPALPDLVNLGKDVILLALARVARWGGSRRRRSGSYRGRGGLLLLLLFPRKGFGDIRIVEGIVLGGVAEPFLNPSRPAGRPPLFAFLERFASGRQLGQEPFVGHLAGLALCLLLARCCRGAAAAAAATGRRITGRAAATA